MSQLLGYKDYFGSVLYSAEDRCLHGRILGIRDMVSYEGTTVRGLEKNFKAAVDEYLAFCEAEGKAPDKPYKGNLNIRLSQDLHRKASRFAEQRDQKLNAVINDALEHYLAHVE